MRVEEVRGGGHGETVDMHARLHAHLHNALMTPFAVLSTSVNFISVD